VSDCAMTRRDEFGLRQSDLCDSRRGVVVGFARFGGFLPAFPPCLAAPALLWFACIPLKI
jgi:hypothetical protein